jgi:membrane protease subunit HflK
MAWNQPGGGSPGGSGSGGSGGNKNPWSRKPNRGADNGFTDFKRKLEALLKGGGSGGGSGDGGSSAGDGSNESSIVLAVIAVAVMLWGYLSFFQVEAAEQAVIQRFGKYVETRGSGWGFRIWPIESVTMVNTKAVNSVKYESRALTSDLNLVDLTFTVQYQLRDPAKFLFKVRDAEDGTLQEVSESAKRTVIARSEKDPAHARSI